MTKIKALKILIISLLVVSFTSLFFVFAVDAVFYYKEKETAQVSAWVGGGTADNPYLISSTADMTSLANAISGRTSHTGKYFKLTTDIDFEGASFKCFGSGRNTSSDGSAFPVHRFNGIFDGNGFSIKNAKLTGTFQRLWTKTISNKKNVTYCYQYTALFINLGEKAVVKNLKIEGCSSGVSQSASTTNRKNYYEYSDLAYNVSYFTGGTIENCYIVGMDPTGPITKNNNLILNGATPKVDGTNVYGSLEAEAPTLTGLTVSSAGGSNGIPWYNATEYHSGWPIPRVFIKSWDRVTFDVTPPGSAEGVDFIEIPSDATKCYSDTTSELLLIYDQEVYAGKPAENYKFVKWTATNRLKYVAHYELIKIDIVFGATVGSVIIDPSIESITVIYGSRINISVDYNANTFTYVITDTNGDVTKVVYDLSLHKESVLTDFVVTDDFIVRDNITIKPTASFKNYDIEFE